MNETGVNYSPARIVAGMGQLSVSFTLEKSLGKGVALSRANAHHIRPTLGKMLVWILD